MGCFNVACSISNLSISAGTPTLFIPLLPHKYNTKPMLVGNHTQLTYPHCYFDPFCLPIEGTYNDYGSLENIVENENTKAIEKFFKMPLDDFFCYIGECFNDVPEGTHNGDVLKEMSGMFVLKDIYDAMSRKKTIERSWGPDNGSFSKQYNSYRNGIISSKNYAGMDKELRSLLKRLKSFESGPTFVFKNWVHFSKLYDSAIKKGKLKEELRWFDSFYGSMYSCNRFFFPAMNGEQHGNKKESKLLLEASLAILNGEIKREEDEERKWNEREQSAKT